MQMQNASNGAKPEEPSSILIRPHPLSCFLRDHACCNQLTCNLLPGVGFLPYFLQRPISISTTRLSNPSLYIGIGRSTLSSVSISISLPQHLKKQIFR
uniref:Uncharacterized protein n=1 Tax=Oryza glumipatula TaxID=40148 RepID=A0A0E0AS63_9ORYZ